MPNNGQTMEKTVEKTWKLGLYMKVYRLVLHLCFLVVHLYPFSSGLIRTFHLAQEAYTYCTVVTGLPS